MDRFESPLATLKMESLSEVYIPIWIDLKGVKDNGLGIYFQVYIPIWIDLKGYLFFPAIWQDECLHSNMDRFESV